MIINLKTKLWIAAVMTVLILVLVSACTGAPKPNEPIPTGGKIILETPENTTADPSGEGGETASIPETEAPTNEPTPTDAPAPTPAAAPTEAPFGEAFIDLEAVKTYYVVPGKDYSFDFGDTTGWSVDGRGVMTASFSGSKLNVKATGTGYAKLTGPSGSIGYIYSNLAVEKTEARKVVSGFPYYLYYEKGKHVLTVYTADSEGYYTVPFRTISAASGSTPSKTPVGSFKLGEKLRWKVFGATCHAQYGIAYASGVFLHGPCYTEQRENSIISHYYNSIGESSTGGCLRMQTGNIYWIYKNCDTGTKLEIVDGSPRGLDCEKPADIPESACYDPTDPALKRR